MKNTRWTVIGYNSCFALNSLLLFLALFTAHLQVPALLQVTGRMHPLLLHFPIVLLVLAAVWETAVKAKGSPLFYAAGDALLLTAAVSAALTALLGLFLSKEGGYDATTLFWHQWSGVAVSLLAFAWYGFRQPIRTAKIPAILVALLSTGTLTLAGHLGATLTHGENYLLAPITSDPSKIRVPWEDALVFRDLVRPILAAKCMSCHHAGKAKGALAMDTEALLLKGGKHGPLWDSTATAFGHLLQRIHLPVDAKEHMPPAGKAQLTAPELEILYHWIKNGANFQQKIVDLPETDTLRMLAADYFKPTDEEVYPFAAADETTVQKLNNDYRVVQPLAMHAQALQVEFFGTAAFQSVFLQDLQVVKEQIVSLNLHKMPVQDADLPTIATFPNLRKLNLSFTQITGATLGELKKLKALRQLSLSGTAVKAADIEVLRELPDLSVVQLWNTGIAEAEFAGLQQRMPNVHLESGYSGANVVAKLNTALIESDAQVFTHTTRVKLKNYIHGAAVRYTLDGSIPDSLTSPVSNGDSITIDHTCVLTTKTFLPGWISSGVASRYFYKTGYTPDSITLRYPPDPQHKGEGPKTLVNQKIGETDFSNNKWLGYRATDLECLLFFNTPTAISTVSLSTLVNIGSYIMPAAEIQVWGGPTAKSLVLLQKLRPSQPAMVGAPAARTGFTCTFATRQVRVLKLVVKPVAKLPAWHPGKGERGWVFVDEIFLN